MANIAQPDAGLITNFGKAHLEGFGSLEGVVKAKSELFDYLKTTSGLIFANADDPKIMAQLKGQDPITYGTDTTRNGICNTSYGKGCDSPLRLIK